MSKSLKRLMRWTAGGLSAVIVVCIAIIVFGDLSAFRAKAEKAASDALGTPVRITGEMSLRPALPPVVELNDVTISNFPGASHANLLSVGKLYVSVPLGSLITGKVKITKIELESFEINVERNNQSDQRWRPSKGSDIDIKSIKLTDGVMRWVDPAHGAYPDIQIHHANSALGTDEDYAQVDITVHEHRLKILAHTDPIQRLFDDSPWEVKVDINAQDWSLESAGTINTHSDAQFSFHMEARSLSGLNDLLGLSLPPLGPTKISATLSATSLQSLKATRVTIELGENRFSGDIELFRNDPDIGIRAEIQTPQLQLAEFLELPESGNTARPTEGLQDKVPMADFNLANIDVGVSVESLLYHDINFNSAHLQIGSNEGFSHSEENARVPTNDDQIILTVTTDNDLPLFRLEGSTSGLDLGTNVPGSQAIPLSGQAVNADFDITASGKTWRALADSLSGKVQIENLTFNHPPIYLSDADTLVANQLSVQASNGVVQNVALTGTLGKKSIHLDLGGEKTILPQPDAGSWPLAGLIKYADATLEIDGHLGGSETPSYRGSLHASTEDINTLGQFAGLPPFPRVRFELQSQIDGSAQLLSLKDLSLQLGASKFTGDLDRKVVENRLHYQGLLKVDTLNVLELEDMFSGDNSDNWLPQDVDMDITLSVDKLQGAYEKLSSIEVTAALNQSQLDISALSFEVHGKPIQGTASIDESVAPTRMAASLNITDIDTNTLSNFGLNYPGLTVALEQSVLDVRTEGRTYPEMIEQLTLKFTGEAGEIGYSNEQPTTAVKALNLRLNAAPGEAFVLDADGIHENIPLALNLSVDSLSALLSNKPISISATTTSPHSSLHVEGDITSPREFDGVKVHIASEGNQIAILHPSLWLPWEQAGPFRINTTLEHKDHQLTLRDVQAVVDGNDLSGMLIIPTDADGQVEVNLNSNSIIIGDVLEPNGNEDKLVEPNAHTIPSFPLAKVLPMQWNGNVNWQIGRLQLDHSVFEEIQFHAHLDAGRLTLEQTGVTYPDNGPFSLLLAINPDSLPAANLRMTAEQFDLGWMLPNDVDSEPHWPTDIDITLSGPAETFQQLLGGASGTIDLSGGHTEGAEFEKWDLNLLSRMLPKLGEKAIDQINCMVIELDVENGVASADGAVMETQHAVVAGGGTVDLRSEQLDLLLSGQPKNEALLNITASLKIEGAMSYPKVELVSTNIAFGPVTILRSVTHPISLLQSFFGSSGESNDTACEAALTAAERAHPHHKDSNNSP